MTIHNDPQHLENIYGKPYSEIIRVARDNLRKAGCAEEEIDFVINYGGIYQAYENDLEVFRTNPLYALEILTTD